MDLGRHVFDLSAGLLKCRGCRAEHTTTGELKSLANNAAMAVLRELNTLARFPVPLPDTPPKTWHATSEANAGVQRHKRSAGGAGPLHALLSATVCCTQ